MLTLSEINKIIKKELGSALKKYGYVYNSKLQFYARKEKEGYTAVVIGVKDYSPKFVVTPAVLIRIDSVENLVSQFQFVLPDFKDWTYTIHTGVKFFDNIGEYVVYELPDLMGFVKYFTVLFENKIMAFLDSASDVSQLDVLLHEKCLQIGQLDNLRDYMQRISICKLSNNPRFDNIVEFYLAEFDNQFPTLEADTNRTQLGEFLLYIRGI